MPEKFVFFIYNSEKNSIYFNMTFGFFNVLLASPGSQANDFISKLDEFTIEEFTVLQNRLRSLDTETLYLTEKEAIIIVAVLNYTSFSLLNDNEEKILQAIIDEDGEDSFYEMRNKTLNFATYIIDYLKTNLTHCKRFVRVIQWLES